MNYPPPNHADYRGGGCPWTASYEIVVIVHARIAAMYPAVEFRIATHVTRTNHEWTIEVKDGESWYKTFIGLDPENFDVTEETHR